MTARFQGATFWRFAAWGVVVCSLLLALDVGVVLAQTTTTEPTEFQRRLSEAAGEAPETGTSVTGALLRVIVALVVVLAVVLALAYVLRRISGQAQQNRSTVVSVLARVPIGQTQFLSIVDIAGTVVVLGVTDHTVTALSEIEDPTAADQLRRDAPRMGATGLTSMPSFRQWLRKAGDPDA
ncbi:flagellar biosynthetic protein FliO [Candidatus Poribacteria bacterium]|nr:flagellar biosynthetic protein FliO [Candidatus Poribacteria bacterium]